MDVMVWLRGLGLARYEAAFRENEIDETVLPSLTHENLKELGVTALGHRLKLLDAGSSSSKQFSVRPLHQSQSIRFKGSRDRPVEPTRDIVRESSDGAVANR
jgi:hypothetical protein